MDIASLRLRNQLVSASSFGQPHEVVKWLGAVQAQDYAASLWAIGLRLPPSLKVTQQTIQRAADERKIVRTWPMRGTLHWVPAEDVRWMLNLLTPRVIALSAGRHRQLELDDSIFNQSEKILTKALRNGHSLTRSEFYRLLDEANISTAGQRGYHILTNLAQKGIICFGSKRGKQQTFVLLDEWVPAQKTLTREESLAALAERYFGSHGPATLHDFATWSGLTVKDARLAIESVRSNFEYVEMEGHSYWLFAPRFPRKNAASEFLLPPFDEMLCGYKDRSAILKSEFMKSIILKNGILSPTILAEGQVIGHWRRGITKNKKSDTSNSPGKIVIEATLFNKPDDRKSEKLAEAADRYGQFLGFPAELALKGSS